MVANLTEPDQDVDVATLPAAPKNPLPYRQRLRAARLFHSGPEALREAGGPVTKVVLGPKWLVPPLVIVTSPRGIRDVLGRSDAFVEKNIMATEMRHLLGGNLFDLTPRAMASAPTRDSTGVHQTSRSHVRCRHVRGRGNDRRQLGARR